MLAATPELGDMESALRNTQSGASRRIVQDGVVRMLLLRRAPASLLLQSLNWANNEWPRYRLFNVAVRALIDRGDFDDAGVIVAAMRTDALGRLNELERNSGLSNVAGFEAELGRLRQARMVCPETDQDKLWCYSRILEQYQKGRDPLFAKTLEQRAVRYRAY
jgi:hypothetical protein